MGTSTSRRVKDGARLPTINCSFVEKSALVADAAAVETRSNKKKKKTEITPRWAGTDASEFRKFVRDKSAAWAINLAR